MPALFANVEATAVVHADYPLELFLHEIREKYQDPVLALRQIKFSQFWTDARPLPDAAEIKAAVARRNEAKRRKLEVQPFDEVIYQAHHAYKEARNRIKNTLPLMMISATSDGGRKLSDITGHTGYLIVDIDDLAQEEVEPTKDLVCRDPHTYACWISAGGLGICAIVPTNKWKNEEEHRECFTALEAYYFNTYGIVLDHSGCNWNRLRAASYDPYIYIREGKVEKFTKRHREEKKATKPDPIHGDSDVERVLGELVQKGQSITETYFDWIKVGAALYSWNPNEQGYQWFRAISQLYSGKYSEQATERKWASFQGTSTKASIATVLWEAKRLGIEPVSRRNRELATIARAAKRGGASLEDAKKRAAAYAPEDPDGIVEKVYTTVDGATPLPDLPLPEAVELYLNSNYQLVYNEVLHEVELDGRPITDMDLNSLWLNCQRDISEKVTQQMLMAVIHSDRIKRCHPVKDYLHALPVATEVQMGDLPHCPHTWHWVSMFAAGTGTYESAYRYMLRWGVGLVGTVLDEHDPPEVYNEIMPVLTGGMGDRKTRAIRWIIPQALAKYFAEPQSETDTSSAKKDMETLAATNILILNDEYKGMKREAAHIKAMLSARVYKNRLPYDRKHTTMRRLASYIATSNEYQLLADITGNRRIVPIPVREVTEEELLTVDPDLLLAEWVTCYKAGVRHYLTKQEGAELNEQSAKHQQTVMEEELLMTWVQPDKTAEKGVLVSQIALHIKQMTGHEVKSLQSLNNAMAKHGFAAEGLMFTKGRLNYYLVRLLIEPK